MNIHDTNKAPFYKLSLTPKRIVEYLRYSTKPSFRYFEEDSWFVHETLLPAIVKLCYLEGRHVNYSELPDSLQMLLAEAKHTSVEIPKINTPSLTGAHAALHLLPTAPKSVIKAAYKALALECHPDRGGDSTVFSKITEAYKQLMED